MGESGRKEVDNNFHLRDRPTNSWTWDDNKDRTYA